MKHILGLLLFALFMNSCQNQSNMAYVDRSVVINGYEKKLDIEKRFQVKNTAFISKRDSLIRQYESERQVASVRAQSMSNEEIQQLGLEFQQKEALLGQQIQAEQQELQQAFDQEIDSVIQEVKAYVVKYGQTNNYDFIFGTSDATNTVMFADKAKDISEAILEQLNQDYKANQ